MSKQLLFFLAQLSICVSCLSAQAASHNVTAASSGETVNVREFGAMGDGVTDDGPALDRAVKQAQTLGSGASLYIPSGNYFLASKPMSIQGITGLTVYGDGKATILTEKNGFQPVILLDHCNNVVIRKLTLNRADYYFTQGRVDRVDHASRTCDVTLDPGYPEADAPGIATLTGFHPFIHPDSDAYQQDHPLSIPGAAANACPIQSREHLGNRQWRLFLSKPGVEDDWVGKRFMIWNDILPGHGISASNDTDCLIEDVTYYGRGANAGLILQDIRGTFTIRRFHIDVPPGSNGLISCSGGGQFINVRGKLIFDHCTFLKFDDDGADIFTNYVRIVGQTKPNTLILENDNGFQPGDSLALIDGTTQNERELATITQLEKETDSTCTVTLDRTVTVGKTGAGPQAGPDRNRFTDGIDVVVDYNNATSSTEFHDCEFQCLRARALNLKAQNCVVENCKFFDCEMPAIAAGPEFGVWGEGPPVHHLTIRNCEFNNCETANIDIDCFGTNQRHDAYDNQDILIEGNTFNRYGTHSTIYGSIARCAVHVRYASNVMIRNNIFGDSAPDVFKVIYQNSRDVTLRDNQNLPETSVKRETIGD